jgi:hypothetical protein
LVDPVFFEEQLLFEPEQLFLAVLQLLLSLEAQLLLQLLPSFEQLALLLLPAFEAQLQLQLLPSFEQLALAFWKSANLQHPGAPLLRLHLPHFLASALQQLASPLISPQPVHNATVALEPFSTLQQPGEPLWRPHLPHSLAFLSLQQLSLPLNSPQPVQSRTGFAALASLVSSTLVLAAWAGQLEHAYAIPTTLMLIMANNNVATSNLFLLILSSHVISH